MHRYQLIHVHRCQLIHVHCYQFPLGFLPKPYQVLSFQVVLQVGVPHIGSSSLI